MERQKEITKLVNVLRRLARMAQQANWTGNDTEGVAYSVQQYNRVLERLIKIDPDVESVFSPLDDDSPFAVVAMAARQLAAYYEDELKPNSSWQKIYHTAFDPEGFKDFWRQSAKDIEDFGEYIRENIETWANHHHAKTHAGDEEHDEASSERKS